MLRTSGSASYWLCTPRITRRKPYTRSQKRCQCPWLVRGLTQQEGHYYDVISLLLYFLCAAKKKRGPTDRRTEIIQLHIVILISRARSGFAPFLAAAPSPGIKLWCPVHDRLSQQRTPLPGRRERWVRNAHARLNGMARRKGHREERLRTRETHTRQKASGELRHRSGCKV